MKAFIEYRVKGEEQVVKCLLDCDQIAPRMKELLPRCDYVAAQGVAKTVNGFVVRKERD